MRFDRDDSEMNRRELSHQPVRLSDPMPGGNISLQLGKIASLYPTPSAATIIPGGSYALVNLWGQAGTTAILTPNGNGSLGTWGIGGGFPFGSPADFSAIADPPEYANDGLTSLIKTQGAIDAAFFSLTDVPANFGTALTVLIQIRSLRYAGVIPTNLHLAGVQLFQSDETTPLTDFAPITDSFDFFNYAVRPTITGATDATAWNGAKLKIVTDSGVGGEVWVSSARVKLQYAMTGTTLTAETVVDLGIPVVAFVRVAQVGVGRWAYLVKFPWGWEILESECVS